jgi:hypothetical protein
MKEGKMMDRKPRKKQVQQGDYPTLARARSARRDFLKLLGKGLLAIPAAGLANACGVGKEKEYELSGDQAPPDWLERDPDVSSEPDFQLGGVVAEDIHPPNPQDIQEFDLGGVAPPPDIQEQDFPPLAGDLEEPDIQEQDFPPLPGEAPPEPDVVAHGDVVAKEVDAEEWPLDGDMEIPEGF